jgi:uncharacterized protein
MKRFLAAVLLVLLPLLAFRAHGLVPVPPLQALATDLTQTLSAEQLATLETRLRDLQRRKGSQLAVLIVPSTQPEAIEQYAIRVVDQWKLGRKKVDDGALLLVAKTDRAVRIEVGYGLEGALPDAICNRVIAELLTPRFEQNDYFGALDAATAQLVKLIDGEALPDAPATAQGEGVSLERIAPILLVIALMVGGVLRRALGRMPGALVAGAAVGGFAWLISGTVLMAAMGAVIAFVATLLSGSGRSLGGHSAWGGGSSDRSSGGGFGGGGGGGFGGGGASGRW